MDKIIRRQALRSIGGGGLAALLLTSNGTGVAESHRMHSAGETSGVLLQGTLTREHADSRQMSGFVETGIHGGIVLCSLVSQAADNPAVQSIFAAPAEHQGVAGARVTVAFFSQPVGELTFSLLHLPAAAHAAPVRTV